MRAGSSRGRTPRVAVLVALAGAAVALLVLARRPPPAGRAGLRDGSGRILRELERRARSASSGDEVLAGGAPVGPLDRQLAKLFFPAIDKRLVYDPVVYATLRPSSSYTMHLAEHPGGPFELRTNSLGLREDAEPAEVAPELRVLVTGDSHTDGVVPNARSFANRLEALLAAARPEREVEVLNAGVGGYTFQNYVGVLGRWAELAPDVLVVCVYGGNDFAEAMPLERYFRRRGGYRTEPYLVDPLLDLKEARSIGGILEQDVAEAVYFANNPGDVEIAVDTALTLSRELARRCEARDVELLLLYLPPATRAQPELFADHARVAREAVGLSPAQLAVSDLLADRWLAALAGEGIAAIDLRPALRAAEERCFWSIDLHLNLAGHEVVALVLREWFERR